MNRIARQRVADMIIEKIKKQLEAGVLKEGDKLPNMTDYAKILGVSRLSLREAMQTLEQMGAISRRPKVGTIITCGNPAKWAYPILCNELQDPQMFQQLLEARMFFEGILAAQCAMHVQTNDLRKLQKVLDRQSQAFETQDFNAFYECDTQFHTLIASGTKNVFMQRAYTELLQATNPSIATLIRDIPGAAQDSMMMHQKIFEAISAFDSNRAEQYALMHLHRMLELYKNE